MLGGGQLPAGVTMQDLRDFLQSIITEQSSAHYLRDVSWKQIKADISWYFDVKLTEDKHRLVAEESAELVAGAASIAAAAGSWVPFVNFALEVTALAALAAQTGLEIAIEKLEGTIIKELANADTNISSKTSFRKIKPHSDAVKKNTSMFPRLQLGGRTSDLRAMFLSIVIATKKQNKGIATVDLVKQRFVDIYNAANDSVLAPIMADYVRIIADLDDRLAQGKPMHETPGELEAELAKLFAQVPPSATHAFSGAMMMFTAVLTSRYGTQAYSAWKATKHVILEEGVELTALEDESGAAAGEEAVGDLAQEAGVLSKVDIVVKAIGVLAGVASLVFAGLEISTAVNTEKNLTKAFNDAKLGITTYYSQLLGIPNENIPKQPFPDTINPIEAATANKWAQAILGQLDWDASAARSGTMNTSLQCMESVNDPQVDGLWGVIVSGPVNAVSTTSYICVGGPAARYVDVAVYPGGKYLGWNGKAFVAGPAASADGFYWYKKEIEWTAPFSDPRGVFYAKTYRAPEDSADKRFQVWAYDAGVRDDQPLQRGILAGASHGRQPLREDASQQPKREVAIVGGPAARPPAWCCFAGA